MASYSTMANGKIRAQIRLKIGKDEDYFDDRKSAETWAVRREAEMLSSHAQNSIQSTNKFISINAVAQLYFNSAEFNKKAESSKKREITASKAPLADLGEFSISAVEFSLIDNFFEKRAKQKAKKRFGGEKETTVSGNSIRLERHFLRNLFSYAQKRKYRQTNIMLEKFAIPACNRNEIRLTQQQETDLRNAAMDLDIFNSRINKNLWPYLRFISDTGSRPGEAAKIEIAWIDLANEKISIPRKGSKKRNARVINITDAIYNVVKNQIEAAKEVGSPYLFWSYGTKPRERRTDGSVIRRDKKQTDRVIKPYDYSNGWNTLKKHAGLQGVKLHPHLFRHEFISKLYEETDFSDGQIASIVGDVCTASLEPYRHLNVGKLKDKLNEHLNSTLFKNRGIETRTT